MAFSGYSIRVKDHCRIQHPDGKRFFLPGQVITRSEMDPKSMDEHLRSGFAVPVNSGSEPIPEKSYDQNPEIPGVEKVPVLSGDLIDTARSGDFLQAGPETDALEKIVVNSDGKNNAGQAVSKWVIDPATLTGKSLELLNVQILEIDPSVKLFEDEAEARAWLSQDYGK